MPAVPRHSERESRHGAGPAADDLEDPGDGNDPESRDPHEARLDRLGPVIGATASIQLTKLVGSHDGDAGLLSP